MRKLTRNLVLAGMASMPAVLSSAPALAADALAAHAHGQRGVGVELYFPRPDPDLRQTGDPGRHGLFARQRPLCRPLGSSISSHQYAGGNTEIDYYFGYNGKLAGDWGWTVGFYGYYYPGAKL